MTTETRVQIGRDYLNVDGSRLGTLVMAKDGKLIFRLEGNANGKRYVHTATLPSSAATIKGTTVIYDSQYYSGHLTWRESIHSTIGDFNEIVDSIKFLRAHARATG